MTQDLATELPELVQAAAAMIEQHAEEVTELDRAIGDGDHVFNLQRGLQALVSEAAELGQLDWPAALQKVGMTLLSTMGGASGSLFGTLFIRLGKVMREKTVVDLSSFAAAFAQAVDAVKARGKADLGDKTMLDVLIPVAAVLQRGAASALPVQQVLGEARKAAEDGVESTHELVATKGRASFLGERSRGHLDAGAKSSQLIIEAIAAAWVRSRG